MEEEQSLKKRQDHLKLLRAILCDAERDIPRIENLIVAYDIEDTTENKNYERGLYPRVIVTRHAGNSVSLTGLILHVYNMVGAMCAPRAISKDHLDKA